MTKQELIDFESSIAKEGKVSMLYDNYFRDDDSQPAQICNGTTRELIAEIERLTKERYELAKALELACKELSVMGKYDIADDGLPVAWHPDDFRMLAREVKGEGEHGTTY